MRMPVKTVLVIIGTTLSAGAAPAQPRDFQPKDYKPPVGQVAPALDKVAMTDFVCDPSPIPPGTMQVTLKVTVKNLTAGLQSVTLNGLKVRLLRTTPQPDVVELETTVNNLGPGASQTVGAHVNISPGIREYFARVDPDDTLHEPIVQRANNEKRLKLAIPQVSGEQAPAVGSVPPKETQLLDYDKAKRSGAQFLISREGPSTCGTEQYDVNLHPVQGEPPAGVEFKLACSGPGGRANAEAFANFRLKNGWRVKSFDVFRVSQSGLNADWSWTRTPTVGSDDPSSKLHMWAEVASSIYVAVKVEIEGPAGTNPYQ